MLTLYLLRHAKSSWDHPSLSDFDRPLAARGREAAPRMGRLMRDKGYSPELILCSPALRARQTKDLVLDVLDYDPEVRLMDGLYNFGDGTGLLHIVQQIGSECSSLLLIGHNPSIESLAVKLAGSGKSADLKEMARKYPTAALAVIEFEVDDWSEIRNGKGTLVEFTRPKALHEA
jgi:phosphohistidine phosphatase